MALFSIKENIGSMVFGIIVWSFFIFLYTLFRIYAIPLIPDEILETIKIRIFFHDFQLNMLDIFIYGFLIFKVVDSIFDGFVNSVVNLAIVLVIMFLALANLNYIGFPFGVITILVDLDFLQVQFQISLIAFFIPLLIIYGIFFAKDLIIFLGDRKVPNDCVDTVWGGRKGNFDELQAFRVSELGGKVEEVKISAEDNIMPKF